MQPTELDDYQRHLRARNYSPHTVANYALDLRLFFDQVAAPLEQISWREVEQFVQAQHRQGLAPATINRRLNALKQFFEFLVQEQSRLPGNPVKPSHFLRQGRPLPRRLTQDQVQRLFAQIKSPLDRALFLLMLRAGLRVSEAAQLKLSDLDWGQRTLLVEQGKGRKDRWVYLSADALAALRQCLSQRPAEVRHGYLFWNQKRWQRPLSVTAIQKKLERYAKAVGVEASCHSLRHTFAADLLEAGAELVSIKELLGHESVKSSERYARLSNRKVKQSYLQAIRQVIGKTPL